MSIRWDMQHMLRGGEEDVSSAAKAALLEHNGRPTIGLLWYVHNNIGPPMILG